MTDDLVSMLEPVIRDADLELVDVELRSGVLLVTVDKEGGVDFDALTEATRVASAALDQADPIPGRYSLEVSSPGVERTLRTPRTSRVAIGETVIGEDPPAGSRRPPTESARWSAPTTRGFEIEVAPDAGSTPPLLLGRGQGAHGVQLGSRTAPGSRDTDEGNADEEAGCERMSKTNFEFLDALGQIARDKGISVETLLDALANALVAAYKRRPDAAEEAVVTIDAESGEIRVYGQELDEEGNVSANGTTRPTTSGGSRPRPPSK